MNIFVSTSIRYERNPFSVVTTVAIISLVLRRRVLSYALPQNISQGLVHINEEKGNGFGSVVKNHKIPQHENLTDRRIELAQTVSSKVHTWVWSSASDTYADSMYYNPSTHSIIFAGNNHFFKFGESDCIVGEIQLKDLNEQRTDSVENQESNMQSAKYKTNYNISQSDLPKMAWSKAYRTPYNEACTVIVPAKTTSDSQSEASESMYAFGFSSPGGLMTHLGRSSFGGQSEQHFDPSIFGFGFKANRGSLQGKTSSEIGDISDEIEYYESLKGKVEDKTQRGNIFQDFKVQYPSAVDNFSNGDILVGMIVSRHDDVTRSAEGIQGRSILTQYPLGKNFRIVLQRLRPRGDRHMISPQINLTETTSPALAYSGLIHEFGNANVTETLRDFDNVTIKSIESNVTDSLASVMKSVNSTNFSQQAFSHDQEEPFFDVIWTREVGPEDGISSSLLSDARVVTTALNKEIVLIAGTTSGNGPHVGGTANLDSTAILGESDDYDGFVTKIDGDSGNFLNHTAAPYSIRIASKAQQDELIEGICSTVSELDPYGAIFVVGTTGSILDSDFKKVGGDGVRTAFIRKLSIDTLSTMWTKQIGVDWPSSNSEHPADVTGAGCAVTSDGEKIFVTGVVTNGGHLAHEKSQGGDDIFLATFDTVKGSLLYVLQTGSKHRDSLANHNPVLADKNNHAIITGTVEGHEVSDVFVLQHDPNFSDEVINNDVTNSESLPRNIGYYTVLETPEEIGALNVQDNPYSISRSEAASNWLIVIIVTSSLIIMGAMLFLFRDKYYSRREHMLREQAIHDAIEAHCSSPKRVYEYDIDSYFPRRIVPVEGEHIEQYDFSGSTIISGVGAIKVHTAPDLEDSTRTNYHELLRAYSSYNINDDRDDLEYDDQIYSDDDPDQNIV